MVRTDADYVGKAFSWLTVESFERVKNKNRIWKARCICGKIVYVKSSDLGPSRNRKSCGCMVVSIGDRTRVHGMYKHPVHGVWMSMINRCHLETDRAWRNYGGRGIKVCVRWRSDFRNFWKDMGPTYKPGLTIERVNNDKGYSKSNCVWATRWQQAQNKRNKRRNS